jgi:YcxB-like protein
MQPIQLKFTHTEAEYLGATRLLLFGQKVLLARFIIIMALIMFLSFALAVVGEFELWAALALGLLFNVSIFYMAVVDAPRRVFRKDSKFRDEYALTFSEDGIAVKTHQIDSKLAWSLYKHVLENKSLYVLVFDAPGRMVMTVVPKRVFRDATEELEFRGLVHRKVDQSLALTSDSIGDQRYAYVPSKLEPPDWR